MSDPRSDIISFIAHSHESISSASRDALTTLQEASRILRPSERIASDRDTVAAKALFENFSSTYQQTLTDRVTILYSTLRDCPEGQRKLTKFADPGKLGDLILEFLDLSPTQQEISEAIQECALANHIEWQKEAPLYWEIANASTDLSAEVFDRGTQNEVFWTLLRLSVTNTEETVDSLKTFSEMTNSLTFGGREKHKAAAEHKVKDVLSSTLSLRALLELCRQKRQ